MDRNESRLNARLNALDDTRAHIEAGLGNLAGPDASGGVSSSMCRALAEIVARMNVLVETSPEDFAAEWTETVEDARVSLADTVEFFGVNVGHWPDDLIGMVSR